MKYVTHIHSSQSMNLSGFGLTSVIVLPAGQSFNHHVKYLNIYWMDCDNILYRHS